MKNKGFTLIELLAVIIVISLISIITIPKINDQLEQSRKNISKNAALNYKKAISDYTMHEQMNKNNIELNGTYNINQNGYLYNKTNTYEIEFDGEKPINGNLVYSNNELQSGCITINKYSISFENGEISVIAKGTCEYSEITPMPEIVTSGDGLYKSETDQNRYIFRGENPNNWIELNEGTEQLPNNVMYRIISYEPDGTIKVIRNQSIGTHAWDKRTDVDSGPRMTNNNTYCDYEKYGTRYFGCNAWGTLSTTYYGNSSLSTLNQQFFFRYYPNNTSQLENTVNVGTVNENASLNIYLNHLDENEEYWTQEEALDKYIANHSFNIGGIYYELLYDNNNENKTFNREKYEEKIYTWNGKIGLMNITEYVEASTNPTCVNVYSNYRYNNNYYDIENDELTITTYNDWPCANETYNWLSNETTEWTLTANSHREYSIWNTTTTGYFDYGAAYSVYEVRPTFYLKQDISLAGEGTETNPYYIVD